MLDSIMMVNWYAFLIWFGIVVPVMGFICIDRNKHVMLRVTVAVIGLQLLGMMAIGILYRVCGLA